MKKIRILMRYLDGAIIGMCGEYLHRYQYSIFPVITIIAFSIVILLDVITEEE